MKSGAWASFQSALPCEARAGGEPDPPPPQPATGLLQRQEQLGCLDTLIKSYRSEHDWDGDDDPSATRYVLDQVEQLRRELIAAQANALRGIDAAAPPTQPDPSLPY